VQKRTTDAVFGVCGSFFAIIIAGFALNKINFIIYQLYIISSHLSPVSISTVMVVNRHVKKTAKMLPFF
jgi:hypothetical protein